MTRGLPCVWVDTDIALGAGGGDVDDGFALAALLAAARSGRIELLGVSTVSGNAPAAEAARCARALALSAASAVRIVPGWDAPDGVVKAAAALVALPEGCSVVSLGPLSNLAAAVRADAGFAQRVSLSVVGGNLSSPGILPPVWPHEFNLAVDRTAARAVLAAPWKRLELYPLDVVRRLRCTRRRLREVFGFGDPGSRLAIESGPWLRRSTWRWGSAGFPLWDLPPALAAAGALDVTIAARRFPAAQRRFAGIPAEVLAAVDFDPARAWQSFEELLAAFR